MTTQNGGIFDVSVSIGEMRASLFLILLTVGCSIAAHNHAWASVAAHLQAIIDDNFSTSVARPAYLKSHPKVFFDEAHNNAYTAQGSYKPFVDLITSDGYQVAPNKSALSKKSLTGYDVLVIVNASGLSQRREGSPFAEEEIGAVRNWVRAGGALLLVSGHAPFNAAMSELSKHFEVEISNGFTIDTVHYYKQSQDQTELVFSRDSRLVGEHPITRGRNMTEQINRIISFSGTSLKGPVGGMVLLKLSDTAMDVLTPDREPASSDQPPANHRTVSAAGRAQAIAIQFGKGRVVVVAEAAMLTAQITAQGFRFGMNVPEFDNRQFALNIMHWLSGSLK